MSYSLQDLCIVQSSIDKKKFKLLFNNESDFIIEAKFSLVSPVPHLTSISLLNEYDWFLL